MPNAESRADQPETRRILLATGLGLIFGFQYWRLAEDGLGVPVTSFGAAWILLSHVFLGFSIGATACSSSWWKRGPALGLLFSIPSAFGMPGPGLNLVLYGVVALTAGVAAGIMIAAIADAFFPVTPPSRDKVSTVSVRVPDEGNGNSEKSMIRQRLAEEKGYLEYLDSEREYLGEPGFEKVTEGRIVWSELLDLELQDIDEQVRRISQTAGDAFGLCPRVSNETVKRSSKVTSAKEVLMNSTTHEPLNLNSEELAVLAELLESARTRLLIEIRHTHHRAFRDDLRHRLTLVESLIRRCDSGLSGASEEAGTGV